MAHKLVAAIGLYGTQKAGHSFLLDLGEKVVGNNDLNPNWSATEAIFHAIDALQGLGITKGRVAVHYDFFYGPRVAYIDLGARIPSFGELEWVVNGSVAYTISVDDILKNAKRPEDA